MRNMAKKKFKGLKIVGEVMNQMDTPHNEFDLGENFKENGAGAPSGPKASQTLLNAFRNAYEPVESEHLAQVHFSMGRLREYFQAWIIPKMPDPLPVYLEELDYMGYPVRTGFDGSACIMVRYRGAVEVRAEELRGEECAPCDVQPEEVFVYTDDWEDDLSDIRRPFEDDDTTDYHTEPDGDVDS